jgi:ACS family glucarate transporter-like MFS transporter
VYTVWFAVFVSLVTVIPHSIGSVVLAFIGVRFLLGAGEAVLFPSSNRLVAKWIPSNERAGGADVPHSGMSEL